MLSSSPAVPLHSIDFHDQHRRRLSLRTHGGQEYLTAHDGLPSPEHLTPVSGTPHTGPSPEPSDAGSAPISRRGSDGELADDGESKFASLQRAPSRRTAAVVDPEVSLILVGSVIGQFHLAQLYSSPILC